MTERKAIQDYYRGETAICYGCGRNNPVGMHIRSYWEGDECVCHHLPAPQYTAFPGVVYGGTIASLIDCHCIGTAIAAMHHLEGREYGSEPEITCVTGNLNVSFLKPTPTGVELQIHAKVKEVTPRKAVITASVFAEGVKTARGEVIAVRVPARTFDDVTG